MRSVKSENIWIKGKFLRKFNLFAYKWVNKVLPTGHPFSGLNVEVSQFHVWLNCSQKCIFLSATPDFPPHFYLQVIACLLKLLIPEAPSRSPKRNKVLAEDSTSLAALSVVFFLLLSLHVFMGWGSKAVGIFQALQSCFHTGTVLLSSKKAVFCHLWVTF